jgi:hypothetical protein
MITIIMIDLKNQIIQHVMTSAQIHEMKQWFIKGAFDFILFRRDKTP